MGRGFGRGWAKLPAPVAEWPGASIVRPKFCPMFSPRFLSLALPFALAAFAFPAESRAQIYADVTGTFTSTP